MVLGARALGLGPRRQVPRPRLPGSQPPVPGPESVLRPRNRLPRFEVLELLIPIQVADPARDPRRRRFVLEIVPEASDDAAVVVQLIRLLAKAVIFTGV